MTEFKMWNGATTVFGLGDGMAKIMQGMKHYSIDGIEVSKEQFEIAHAATFKSKTLAGHNLGGYSHNWVYVLETDHAKCSCGLTESAEVFEKTRGMKVNDLPFVQNLLVPCLPCTNSGWPDHPLGAYCPVRQGNPFTASTIDWAIM